MPLVGIGIFQMKTDFFFSALKVIIQSGKMFFNSSIISERVMMKTSDSRQTS